VAPPTFVPEVQFWLGTQWVQIVGSSSKDVFGGPIDLQRGRSDWSSQVQPSEATMSLKNPTGKYSPRNPGSPYFGMIGRNIPIKVFMDGRCRFHGEVPKWTPKAEPNLHVPIEAAGVLRRLSSSDPEPLRSVLYRTMLQEGNLQKPVAYWPGEEESTSNRLYSAVSRSLPIRVDSAVRLSSFSGIASSAAIPVLNDKQIYADIAPYPLNTTAVAMCLVHLPDQGVAANDTPIMVANTTGTARYWRVRVNINRTLNLQVAAPDGSTIGTTGNTSFGIAEEGAILLLALTTSGSDVAWTLRVLNVGRTAASVTSGTVASRTYNRVNRLTFDSNNNLGDTAVGHIGLFTGTVDETILLDALNAHGGETAGRRIERLCVEEEVPFVYVGDLDDSIRMGPQGQKSLIDLLTECAEADAGLLHEPIETARLIGDFEDGTTQTWTGGGASPPTVVNSTVRAHAGTHSLEATWPGGSSDQIVHAPQPSMYVVGLTYTLSAWVYVPSGSSHATLAVGGVGFGPSTTSFNSWQYLEYTFTCTARSNEAQLWAQTPSTAGGKVYVDDIRIQSIRPGLGYRTRASLYNTDSSLTLDFDLNQIALPFEPTDDDQLLANDVSVTREGGATFRQQITTGPNSIPLAGRKRSSSTVVVETDEYAEQLSRWLAHLGTWDEMRAPQLTVSLTRNPTLAAQVCAVDLGHRVSLLNPPAWLPPDTIELMAQGCNEELDARSWRATFNCTPFRPYQVVRLDSGPVKKVSPTDSQLNAGINASVTSISVKSVSGRYLWTTGTVSIPITIDGEDLTVTNISGATSPQTFTVTRGVNGYPASHSANAPVTLRDRPTIGL
jgi:hypothetical protein